LRAYFNEQAQRTKYNPPAGGAKSKSKFKDIFDFWFWSLNLVLLFDAELHRRRLLLKIRIVKGLFS